MKRTLILLLCGLVLAPVATGCAENTNEDNLVTDVKTSADTTEQDPQQKAKDAYSMLKKVNLDGEKFTIVARKGQANSEKEVWVEDMTGDVITDEVFKRNSKIAEDFNTRIELNAIDNVPSEVHKNNSSGDTAYKLAYPNMIEAASMAASGLFLNYLDMENININEEWWDQGTYNLQLAGKVYFMNGDINYMDNDVTYIMLFNKKLIEDLNLDVPYQLVYDMQWTTDKFMEMCMNTSADINGDSRWNELDRYGYVTTTEGSNTFFYGAGLSFVQFDSEGEPYLGINMDKTTTLLEKVSDLMTKNNTAYIPPNLNWTQGMSIFMNDRALFYGEVLSYVINLKDMESEFGVLPIPKYDEAQDRYYTYCDNYSSTVGIPSVHSDVDAISAVLEAMAIQSHLLVTPAYYEIALQRKYTRDLESSDMLDIALANRCYDMGMIYTTLGFTSMFGNLANAGSTNFVSEYDSKIKSANRFLNSIMSQFNNLDY